MRTLHLIFIVFFLFACQQKIIAQENSKIESALLVPDKLLNGLNKKLKALDRHVEERTNKHLKRLQMLERELLHQLSMNDSVLANELFDLAKINYKASSLNQIGTRQNIYFGNLDSINTAIEFLTANNLAGIKSEKLGFVQKELSELQSKLNTSEYIGKYLQDREALLKSVFEKLGMINKLKSFRKQVYYYKEQINAYKSLVQDPQRLQEKFLQQVLKHPAFKNFFANHSELSSLFALPGSSLNRIDPENLQGLQTRNVYNQEMIDRFGSGQEVSQAMQGNIASAQTALNQLKEKLESFSGNESTETIPGFKPNHQKSKTFKQRIEYGLNIQSQKARYYFPVTSDLGLSVGYKLNDRSVIGLGASYKIGWGRSWNEINISHQGFGIRTYLDWKIRSSFFICGGYEQNYRTPFHSITQLKNNQSWQKSGLIGISKRYQLNKKFKGEIKLLWDFLSYQQIPATQAFVFRFGYSLK